MGLLERNRNKDSTKYTKSTTEKETISKIGTKEDITTRSLSKF